MIDSANQSSAHRLASRQVRILLALVMFGGTLLAGCGDGAETTSLQGRVTYNGKAVTSGLINFQAEGQRPLGGGINADGTYSFELPPGEYRVRIDAPAPIPPGHKEGDPLPDLGPRPVPEQFADFSTSGLTASVQADGGSQTLDFTLP